MEDKPFNVPLVDRSRMTPGTQPPDGGVYGLGEARAPSWSISTSASSTWCRTDGQALRYGVGVGRQGFSWRGTAYVGRKGVWPAWSPTSTMVSLKPELPRYREAGLDNPLGARALYLYQDGHDTLFRIHGTNEPWSIGEQVSSGCVRMLNEDIVDLYNRVPSGTTVYVKRGGRNRV